MSQLFAGSGGRRSSSVHTELVKESISLFKALVLTLNSLKIGFKSYKLYLVFYYKKVFIKGIYRVSLDWINKKFFCEVDMDLILRNFFIFQR